MDEKTFAQQVILEMVEKKRPNNQEFQDHEDYYDGDYNDCDGSYYDGDSN